MSLLPDVEHELMRLAQLPFKAEQADRPRHSRAGAVVAVLSASIVALIVALVFVAGHSPRQPIAPSTHPAPVPFPGAPQTQPGDWMSGNVLCPLAKPNSYLPPRSGCVKALLADVDGDGDRDLVLLYAHLSHRHSGDLYAPTGFTLELDRASEGIVRAQIPKPIEDNASLVLAGNVNGVPGVELFIQFQQISSGSAAWIYTFHAGQLIRLSVPLAWGGDSATKAGFSCDTRAQPPTLTTRSFELQGTENGRWRLTRMIYTWHGATLKLTSRRDIERIGLPPKKQTSLGVGCGNIDRAIF